MASLGKFMDAIARMEGFYKSGSVAQRNNNPGNLRSWGSNPIVGGYAQFRTVNDGWMALKSQIRTNINRCLTMYEFFAGTADLKNETGRERYVIDPFGPVDRMGTRPQSYWGYSPGADGNSPIQYAEFVAGLVKVDKNRPLCLYNWADDWTGSGSVPQTPTSTPTNSGSGTNVEFDFDSALSEAGGMLQQGVAIPGIGAVPLWQLGIGGIALVLMMSTSKRRR